MYTIKINFKDTGIPSMVLRHIEPGYSLLEVLLKNNIHLHHRCGGACTCSTCHLFVNKGCEFLQEVSTREKHFIQRAINHDQSSRLACQCLLLEDEGSLHILLPEQQIFLQTDAED